jgi:hypothetical protein
MTRRVSLDEAFALSRTTIKVIAGTLGSDQVIAGANERRLAIRIYASTNVSAINSLMINQPTTATVGMAAQGNSATLLPFSANVRNDGTLPMQEFHQGGWAASTGNFIVIETLMPEGIELYGDISSQSPGGRLPTL